MIKFLMTAFISLSFASMVFAAVCGGGGASDCLSCHKEYSSVLSSPMFTKEKEGAFTAKTVNMFDPEFSKKNCSSCHVSSCNSCHKEKNGSMIKPATDECIVCHRDGFTGGDYVGMGIREDHERYRRGPVHLGENYMQMTPDIHFEKGLTCGACHSMASIAGKGKVKDCRSCHDYDKKIIDHSIAGHGKVACVSCHGAWAPMELGTFYIRTVESSYREYFAGIRELGSEYLKSSFMRVNERPPLAIDSDGLYVPIKPSFIIFTNYIYKNLVIGMENNMIAGRWKVFTPHTIRREVALCGACHDSPRRFMLERDNERVLMPDKDGLPLKSFYNSNGFTLSGGQFVTEGEFIRIKEKNDLYIKKYFKKLDELKEIINEAQDR